MSSGLRTLSDLVVAIDVAIFSLFYFTHFTSLSPFTGSRSTLNAHSTPGSMSGLVRFIQHIALELGFFLIDIYHVLEQTYLSIATNIDLFLEVLVLK